MEQKLKAEFASRLLDYAIRYHARRGIRWWCDCSFCTAKKIGTARIGHYHWISPAATSYSNKYPKGSYILPALPPIPRPYMPPQWHMEWIRGDAWQIEEYRRRQVLDARERERVKLRAELAYERQRVL